LIEHYLEATKDEMTRRRDLVYQCAWLAVPTISEDDITVILDGDEDLLERVASDLDVYATLNNISMTEPGDAPLWSLARFISIHGPGWLVHCSDESFCSFERGVEDIGKLGLTTYLPMYYKERPGYNVAFELDGFERYGMSRGRCKYGNKVYLVHVPKYADIWNYADEEPQAVFWGQYAEVVVSVYVDGGDYIVSDPWYDVNEERYLEAHPDSDDDLEEEREFENLEEAVDWLEERREMAGVP